MPITTLSDIRGRGRGKGRGRSSDSRGRGRSRGGRDKGASRGGRSVRSQSQAKADSAWQGAAATVGQATQNSLAAASQDPWRVDEYLSGVTRLQQKYDDSVKVLLADKAAQQAAETVASCQPASEPHSNLQQQTCQQQSTGHSHSTARTTPQGFTADIEVIDLCDDNVGQAFGVQQHTMNKSVEVSPLVSVKGSKAASLPTSQAPAVSSSRPSNRPGWSVGLRSPNLSGPAHGASDSNSTANPFWNPPQYLPVGGAAALAALDHSIRTNELVEVFDTGLRPHKAKAVLDTGNRGCTLIVRPLAHLLGLVDALGRPTESYSRTIKVQGVVAGASEMIKTVTLTYEMKGKRMTVTAGVTEACMGCELLISCHDIACFEADGYKFSAR